MYWRAARRILLAIHRPLPPPAAVRGAYAGCAAARALAFLPPGDGAGCHRGAAWRATFERATMGVNGFCNRQTPCCSGLHYAPGNVQNLPGADVRATRAWWAGISFVCSGSVVRTFSLPLSGGLPSRLLLSFILATISFLLLCSIAFSMATAPRSNMAWLGDAVRFGLSMTIRAAPWPACCWSPPICFAARLYRALWRMPPLARLILRGNFRFMFCGVFLFDMI